MVWRRERSVCALCRAVHLLAVFVGACAQKNLGSGLFPFPARIHIRKDH
jgi:hypothetical protein